MKWDKFPFKVEKQYRLDGWNYSHAGFYFITICAKDRVNYFGEIENGRMWLSEIGEIVDRYWQEIPKHVENIDLDKYVIMPDHFHGIIIVNNVDPSVGTHHDAFLQQNDKFDLKYLATKSTQTIPLAIKLFKSSVTKYANQNKIKFAWQLRFHDRIIRNENEYWAKRKYIESNVVNWGKEKDEVL